MKELETPQIFIGTYSEEFSRPFNAALPASFNRDLRLEDYLPPTASFTRSYQRNRDESWIIPRGSHNELRYLTILDYSSMFFSPFPSEFYVISFFFASTFFHRVSAVDETRTNDPCCFFYTSLFDWLPCFAFFSWTSSFMVFIELWCRNRSLIISSKKLEDWMWKEDDILRILKLEDGKKQRIYYPWDH